MPKGDKPGPSQRQIFNAMAAKGMVTENPVKIMKPIQFKPRQP